MDAQASFFKIPSEKIFVADDQHVNIEVLKEHFEGLQVLHKCEFFYSG